MAKKKKNGKKRKYTKKAKPQKNNADLASAIRYKEQIEHRVAEAVKELKRITARIGRVAMDNRAAIDAMQEDV